MLQVATLLMCASLLAEAPAASAKISWEPALTPAVFQKAQAEKRFVLLDLAAVWCHWCHVMDETTYRDPGVAKLISAHYLAVRVDQDSAPELAARYDSWGWPATIVFAPDGTEIVKRRGYLKPDVMRSLLEAIVEDPSPGPSVLPEEAVKEAARTALNPALTHKLEQRIDGIYDAEHGGWGGVHRLLDAEVLEYALARAEHGDAEQDKRAHKTLVATLALLDPVFGGLYQYSDTLDWKSPHFEKLTSIQAQALQAYALGYARWKDKQLLEGARAVHRYLNQMLKGPDGAFFVSQDADLSQQVDGHVYYRLGERERRARGLPPVDRHVYARENGWVITSLCRFADATGDVGALDEARRAAQVMQATRRKPDGLFWHATPEEPPVLADSLAMAQAFYALYQSTADRTYLSLAEETLGAIDNTFRDATKAGYGASRPTRPLPGVLSQAVRQPVQNAELARLANGLFQASGKDVHRRMAESAMRFLTGLASADVMRVTPMAWLANAELSHPPLHLTVVGSKGDPAAQALFTRARATARTYRLLEWLDGREGPLPHPAPPFPQLQRAALFVCQETACSRPIFTPDQLDAFL